MARSKSSSRSASGSRGGGALFGVMAGVVLGLMVAAGVAVYISGAPMPFVDRTSRGPDPLPAPLQERRDPNLGLSSAGIAPPSSSLLVPGGPSAAGPAAGSTIPAVPGARPAAPGQAAPASEPPDALGALVASLGNRSTATPPAAGQPAPIPTAPAGRYVLQVGAFRILEDAEALKARLALMGFEARVQQATVNGVLVNRVQVGPYANLEALNTARERLTANRVESAVVRQ